MPQTFYTEEEYKVAVRSSDTFKNFFVGMEQKMCSKYRRKIEKSQDLREKFKENWEFIPLNFDVFMQQMEFVKSFLKEKEKIHNLKFLDVGCGVGSKMYIARCVFDYKVSGIEINDVYLDDAEEIFGISKGSIFVQDALEFQDYDKYDVVYFYCPFKNKELQTKLELHIKEKMKKGAILIGNLVATRRQKEVKKQEFEINNKFGIPSKWTKLQNSGEVLIKLKD